MAYAESVYFAFCFQLQAVKADRMPGYFYLLRKIQRRNRHVSFLQRGDYSAVYFLSSWHGLTIAAAVLKTYQTK